MRCIPEIFKDDLFIYLRESENMGGGQSKRERESYAGFMLRAEPKLRVGHLTMNYPGTPVFLEFLKLTF